jgi:hypothetical protein
MDQDLQSLCEELFCKHVDKLIAEKLARKQRHDDREYVEAPVIGDWYLVEQAQGLKRLISRALITRAGWELQKPYWAPPLPLRADEIEELKRDLLPSLKVMGHYAESLRLTGWSRHPPFTDYCAGLCALPLTARLMGNDGLWVPPRPLPGLDGRTMHWTAPA